MAVIAVILWSTVATAFKTALAGMTIANLLFISTFVSFMVLLIILLFKHNLLSAVNISLKEWISSAVMGLLNPFLYYMVLLKAYYLLPAQIAQPLNYTWPVVLVVLSAPFLGHKISFKTLIALIISFIGVIVISSQGKYDFRANNPFGVFLATGSSVIWSVFWLMNLKDNRPDLQKLFLNFFFGFLYISIYMLFVEPVNITFNKSFFASVYIGFFEMSITFLLWLTALRYSSSPEKISSLVFLSPFLSIFFIFIFLHENIHFTTIIGLCLIVAGILLSKTKLKKVN